MVAKEARERQEAIAFQDNSNIVNKQEKKTLVAQDSKSLAMVDLAEDEERGNDFAQSGCEPKLYLDVNLGHGVKAKLFIYEGENYKLAVDHFSKEHSLSKKK